MSAATAISPKLTVVIVTYRSKETIAPTLDALKAAYDEKLVDIVVIDNASNDGTADFVAQRYPFVALVRNRENIGFGRACNQGFDHSTTPYVLLLNPDAVLSLGPMKILVDFMDRTRRAGICAPAVRRTSGSLQAAGNLPNPLTVMLSPMFSRWTMRGQKPIAPGGAPDRTEWICGSIMLVRKDMLKEIGAFDPRFFLYFEETDLCHRAHGAGWEIWTVGEAVGEHMNAASAATTDSVMHGDTIAEHYYRSRYYYLTKHFGRIAAATAEIGELAFLGLRTVIDRIRGKERKTLEQRLRAPVMKLPSPVE